MLIDVGWFLLVDLCFRRIWWLRSKIPRSLPSPPDFIALRRTTCSTSSLHVRLNKKKIGFWARANGMDICHSTGYSWPERHVSLQDKHEAPESRAWCLTDTFWQGKKSCTLKLSPRARCKKSISLATPCTAAAACAFGVIQVGVDVIFCIFVISYRLPILFNTFHSCCIFVFPSPSHCHACAPLFRMTVSLYFPTWYLNDFFHATNSMSLPAVSCNSSCRFSKLDLERNKTAIPMLRCIK